MILLQGVSWMFLVSTAILRVTLATHKASIWLKFMAVGFPVIAALFFGLRAKKDPTTINLAGLILSIVFCLIQFEHFVLAS